MNKNLLEANIKLADDNKELIKDIKTLIKYYTTDNETEKENLENAVQEIIKYYEGKKLGR